MISVAVAAAVGNAFRDQLLFSDGRHCRSRKIPENDPDLGSPSSAAFDFAIEWLSLAPNQRDGVSTRANASRDRSGGAASNVSRRFCRGGSNAQWNGPVPADVGHRGKPPHPFSCGPATSQIRTSRLRERPHHGGGWRPHDDCERCPRGVL